MHITSAIIFVVTYTVYIIYFIISIIYFILHAGNVLCELLFVRSYCFDIVMLYISNIDDLIMYIYAVHKMFLIHMHLFFFVFFLHSAWTVLVGVICTFCLWTWGSKCVLNRRVYGWVFVQTTKNCIVCIYSCSCSAVLLKRTNKELSLVLLLLLLLLLSLL